MQIKILIPLFLLYFGYVAKIQALPNRSVKAFPGETVKENVKKYDVTNFGALGDSNTINTEFIQLAIDLCFKNGGGEVFIPDGVFLTGSLELKSNVILRLADKAILRASPDINDYKVKTAPLEWSGAFEYLNVQLAPCLIYAENAQHVGIIGNGKIDGQGGSIRKIFPNAKDKLSRRPIIIRFQKCTDVFVSDITLIDPPAFTTFFVKSENVFIDGVKIRSRSTSQGDGLDFNGCRNVKISNCDINSGDDAISPKAFDPKYPNENFTITNCKLSSDWAAIRLGPESNADMRNFVVRDCQFIDCRDGIKIETSEGYLFEDLTFSDIVMAEVNRPIYVTASRMPFSVYKSSIRPPTGRISGLTIHDVTAVARQGSSKSVFDLACVVISGLPGYFIQNVKLSNLNLTFPGGHLSAVPAVPYEPEKLHIREWTPWAAPFTRFSPASAIFLRHTKNVSLNDLKINLLKEDTRPLIVSDDVSGFKMNRVKANSPGLTPALVKAMDSKDISARNCGVKSKSAVPIIVQLSGNEQLQLDSLRDRSKLLDNAIQKVVDAVDLDESRARTIFELPSVWDFQLDSASVESEWKKPLSQGNKKWDQISVAQGWKKQYSSSQKNMAWYSVAVNTPGFDSSKNVFLKFNRIDGVCRVWIDGTLVGERLDESTYLANIPFVLDVTGHVKPSSVHRILVQVFGNNDKSGITKTVELRLTK